MNRWNIPDWLEQEVIARDRSCVYCGIEFDTSAANRRNRPSWEHIINDASIVTGDNIALCCIGCNASKGAKDLTEWLNSRYCETNGITPRSVAPIIRRALLARAMSDDPQS